MHFFLKLINIFIISIASSECFKVLLVAPISSPSHLLPQVELAKALGKKGHDVTLLSTYQSKEQITNVRFITVEIITTVNTAEVSLFEYLSLPRDKYFNMLIDLGTNSTEEIFKNENVHEFLSNPDEKFDVVIVEQFFTYALQGFCYHFDAHCILYSSLRFNSLIKPLLGYTAPLSYVSDPIMGYGESLSFFERVHNLFAFFRNQYEIQTSALPKHNLILQQNFKRAPKIQDVIYNVSLVLQNSHISINYPAPEPPKVIEIGGFHITSEEIPSEDIKQFLDSNPGGVIFFSFGSVLKSAQLSYEKMNILFKAFSKIKQKVLWKFEDENLEGKPDNVKIVKWAPQKYILGHPNVKLFISHGGMFSTIEAVHFGKPVMGIPVYGDQVTNMEFLNKIGMAKFIQYKDITVKGVATYIEEILSRNSFTEKAKENSILLHDQSMHPMDKAIYWIEYVYKHKGTSRMSLPGLKLDMYEVEFLDVFVFIFVMILVSLKIISSCMKKTHKKRNHNKKNN